MRNIDAVIKFIVTNVKNCEIESCTEVKDQILKGWDLVFTGDNCDNSNVCDFLGSLMIRIDDDPSTEQKLEFDLENNRGCMFIPDGEYIEPKPEKINEKSIMLSKVISAFESVVVTKTSLSEKRGIKFRMDFEVYKTSIDVIEKFINSNQDIISYEYSCNEIKEVSIWFGKKEKEKKSIKRTSFLSDSEYEKNMKRILGVIGLKPNKNTVKATVKLMNYADLQLLDYMVKNEIKRLNKVQKKYMYVNDNMYLKHPQVGSNITLHPDMNTDETFRIQVVTDDYVLAVGLTSGKKVLVTHEYYTLDSENVYSSIF